MPPDPSPGPSKAPERPTPPDGKGPSWRVDPARDGRGAPPEPKPPMIPRSRRFIAFIVGLLALNFILAFVTGGPAKHTAVPYSPFFLEQVRAGNVQEISSRAETIQGDLKRKATFTPPGGKPKTVDLFETEVPSFVDTRGLTQVLE
ncbi:MAG: cell division protease FtsH, partial [Solirubrobacteraceae bacterium]|nr:cell division protease FtsH [Solirubrobacteraceae bacterium]